MKKKEKKKDVYTCSRAWSRVGPPPEARMAAKPLTILRTVVKNRALSAPGLASSRSPAQACSLQQTRTASCEASDQALAP